MIWIALSLLFLMIGCGGKEEKPEVWSVGGTLDFGRMPRWSPDGSLIAFGEDRPGRAGIWTWDGDSDPIQFPNLPPHNWDYCWSPDSRRITFSSPAAPDDSLGGVWIVDVHTLEITKVFDRGRDVSWGDSGSALFFQIENPTNGTPGIYTLKSGESVAYQVAAGGVKPEGRPGSHQVAYGDGSIDARVWIGAKNLEPIAVTGTGAIQWDWTLDGRFLFILINRYNEYPYVIRGTIWRVDPEIPNRPDSLTYSAANPSVDRSGSRVAFGRTSGSTWLGIWLNRQGKDVQVARYGEYPDIHPTEDRIVFNVGDGGVRIAIRTE